ncbi:MAG: carbohydrate ABC transporter permease [Gammaproteobacteria bacterium]|nr:carbohydrate ABC transporter permease [Gammaproteobacteria bacterium]
MSSDITATGLEGAARQVPAPTALNRTPSWRRRKAFYNYLGLLPFMAFALFPLYIMLITSLKSDKEISNLSVSPFWATGITLDQYAYLAENTAFFQSWLPNTIIVALASTIISVSVGILAAYSLARLKFRGVEVFGIAVFITYLVPQPLLFIPLIDVVNFIDDFIPIRDTYWSLIITYPTFLTPFVIWLLLGYFKTIPVEVEECAYLDGCSRLGALFRVVLPMAMPGIICAVLFAFTLSWNEFLYSLVFIQAQEAKTIGVGVFTELIRGDVYYWGSLMAACFAGTLPIVVLYSFFMDYYVSGLTSGAIK